MRVHLTENKYFRPVVNDMTSWDTFSEYVPAMAYMDDTVFRKPDYKTPLI